MAKDVISRYRQMGCWMSSDSYPSPMQNTKCIITIPMYNEPDVLSTLKSLYQTDVEHDQFEVWVHINYGEQCSEGVRNRSVQGRALILSFCAERSLRNLFVLYSPEMPEKNSGVGWARKMVMDCALTRFDAISRPQGLIVALDADCRVDMEYVQDLVHLYSDGTGPMAYSFEFSHPLVPEDDQYQAILEYELHLRIYRNALLWSGHEHSQYTVGSAMACTAIGYAAHMGMNKRKAGEDFYFLQKFIKAGHYEYHPEIIVYPSSRLSDRVPFGTGRAMLKYAESKHITTYNWGSYVLIKEWIVSIMDTRKARGNYSYLPETFSGFRLFEQWQSQMDDLTSKTTTFEQFKQKFFQWFDAFQAMKLLHFLRDEKGFENQLVKRVGKQLHSKLMLDSIKEMSLHDMLLDYRRIDKKKGND